MLVDPLSPDVLIWLVNEWGTVPRAAAGEDQAPYPDTDLLAALLAGSGVRSCPPSALTDRALGQVADRLHRVFGAADLSERVDLVAGLLAETAVTAALDVADGHPSATWRVADARLALLAAAALTLRHQLAEHDPDRVGVCSGRRCADAFIDASPAGHRRFCSVTCQNRARIAAWRQRRSPAPAR
ncbi:MAG: CGNR zinc finger domain-containing protein [Actinomycetota bacterium]|nr:CGNR zinc finger domain-containing protein [Actinomycetota bacterium]